jgi:hypothetical protein
MEERMSKRRASIIAAITLATTAIAWSQASMRPGQYEITVEMQLPGIPGAQKITQMDCLTAEEARDFQNLMMKEMSGVEGCTFSNVETTGNKITWDTACDSVTGTSELTFVTDGFTAVSKMKAQGTEVTATTSGKWVGATCTVPDDDE